MKPTQVLGHMLKVASQAPIPVDPAYAKQVQAVNSKQGLAKIPAKPVANAFATTPPAKAQPKPVNPFAPQNVPGLP